MFQKKCNVHNASMVERHYNCNGQNAECTLKNNHAKW